MLLLKSFVIFRSPDSSAVHRTTVTYTARTALKPLELIRLYRLSLSFLQFQLKIFPYIKRVYLGSFTRFIFRSCFSYKIF